MGAGILSGSKVLVGDAKLKALLRDKGFGVERGARQELSLLEALFLVESEKLEVVSGDRALSFEDLLKVGSGIDPEFYAKYVVYDDLRQRGLLVKTGLKFGCDFRVYERGSSVKTGHSKQLIYVIPEEYTCSFPDIARAVRLSQNVNKSMVYAVVDGEGDITYYRIDRIKL